MPIAADTDDPAEAAARLEAALERIAGLAQRPATRREPTAEPIASEVGARLDALIERVRTALGTA